MGREGSRELAVVLGREESASEDKISWQWTECCGQLVIGEISHYVSK